LIISISNDSLIFKNVYDKRGKKYSRTSYSLTIFCKSNPVKHEGLEEMTQALAFRWPFFSNNSITKEDGVRYYHIPTFFGSKMMMLLYCKIKEQLNFLKT